MRAQQFVTDLISLFYPKICPGCGMPMQRTENCICVYCLIKLPKTGFRPRTGNAVEHMFKGRLTLEQASSFMYFRKRGLARDLMHELKYNGGRELGFHLGGMFGSDVKESLKEHMPEMVTTVPLHRKKLLARGFNQSDEIAAGFAKSLGIPFVPDVLMRAVHTDSQTRRKRFDRWQNTSGSFVLKQAQAVGGKHIAILDDVITTGATIESCCHELIKAEGVKLSIFSLCYAIH